MVVLQEQEQAQNSSQGGTIATVKAEIHIHTIVERRQIFHLQAQMQNRKKPEKTIRRRSAPGAIVEARALSSSHGVYIRERQHSSSPLPPSALNTHTHTHTHTHTNMQIGREQEMAAAFHVKFSVVKTKVIIEPQPLLETLTSSDPSLHNIYRLHHRSAIESPPDVVGRSFDPY
ncbi:hypothetical protein L7F22_038715 [Adiantum nelumboides]|nr:hypothetical protein [Adiantum nelumboides]